MAVCNSVVLNSHTAMYSVSDFTEQDADNNAESDAGREETANQDSTVTSVKPVEHNYSAPLPPQRHTHRSDTVISQDSFIFLGKCQQKSFGVSLFKWPS